MVTSTSNSVSHAVANPDQQNDQIEKFGLSKSDMDRFGIILRTINFEAIPIFASNVRQFGHHDTGIISSESSCDSDSISCKIVGRPLCGSFHIVFTLEFDDGVKWMLKIPANGHRFDSVAAAALTSEARTMQLLKSETTIPLPAVYAFDASSCNRLNSPFILMERIDGKPLYLGWFNDEIPKARLEHFRVRALQSLAEAMTQLNKFTLNQGGALEFDSAGRPVGLRGAKVVDAVAMYSQGTASKDESEADQNNAYNHDNHDNLETQDTANANEVCSKSERSDRNGKNVNDNDENDDDIICEKGPFECPKSAFLFDLDRSYAYHKGKDGNEYTKGCYKVLRMFIDLAFSKSSNHGRGFVLTHPDLDVQNVLVADDGTLCGLIDWDGVAAVPREIGCAQYPLWLMRDWVPYYYLYDIREGKTEEDAGYEESSPSELASYRALYAHIIEKEIERRTGGPDKVTAFGTLPKQEAQLTRRSLVMQDLDLAASTPFLTTNILCHIVNQIEQVTEPEWGDTDYDMASDSSCSNEDTVDSETNSDTNSESGEGDPETEAPETDDGVSSHMTAAASLDRNNEGAAMLECSIMSHTSAKVTDSVLGVPQHDHGSQISSDAQMETEKLKMGHSSNTGHKADSFSGPNPLGWTRKLLCFGCNVAEKGLRRIAKVGHVVEDGINEVVELLAEVEIKHHHNTEYLNKGETGQLIYSPGHQQLSKIEAAKVVQPEQPQDKHTDQGMVEPDQPRVIPPLHATAELHDFMSAQDTTDQDHPNEFTSTQPTIRLQDIPARKAELIKAVRARKRANYRADKAKIKEELKIWEQVALMVWSRGISLEQLQGNQLKIARWVVDALEAEKKQEGDLGDDPYLPPAAESAEQGARQSKQVQDSSSATSSMPQPQASLSVARNSHTSKQSGVRKGKDKLVAAKGDKMSPELGNKDASSSELLSLKLPAQTTLTNIPISLKQPEMPSNEGESASDMVRAQKTIIHDDEAIDIPAKVLSVLPSQPSSAPEYPERPEKALGSFQTLCSFGTSCLKKIFSNSNRSEDDQGCPTPDRSVTGSNDEASDRSETEESCKSSATSLSDDEAEFGKEVNMKENADDEFGTTASSAAEIRDYESDTTGDNEVWVGLEKNEAMEKMGYHSDPTFAGGLGKKEDSNKPCSLRIVYDQCSGESIELKDTNEIATIGSTSKSNGEDEEVDIQPREDCKEGLNTRSEKGTEEEVESDKENNSRNHEGDEEENIATFSDDGAFRSRNVFMLLGMDMLDDIRLLRMQEGFLKLLEQY